MACSKCWWVDGEERCSGDCHRQFRKRNIYETTLNWVISLVVMGALLSCISCGRRMTSQEEIYQKWPNLRPMYTTIDTTGNYLIPRGPVEPSAYLYE